QPDPGGHDLGPAGRRAHERRRRDRADLRRAGLRTADRRSGLHTRLPTGAGRRADHRELVRAHQPARRSVVLAAGSAHPRRWRAVVTTLGALPATRMAEPAGLLHRGWRRVLRRPASVLGGVVVLAFVAMALGAPWIARVDPVAADWSQIRKPSSVAHPFGTDDLGRDNFARVVWGSRVSMQAGGVLFVLAISVGGPPGLGARHSPRAPRPA